MKKLPAFLLVCLGLAACSPATPSGASFDEIVASRRSIRSFDPTRSISEAEVRTLLQTVQEAPSWANLQPARYYVVMSPDRLEAAKDLIGEMNKRSAGGASVLIVSTFVRGQSGFARGVAADEIGDGWGAHDLGLSNAFLVLKARAMGFDSLIMGYRETAGLRALLDIPEEESVMAVIALGYRNADPAKPARKPLDEIARFF